MLLAVTLVSGAIVGCESREEVTPATPAVPAPEATETPAEGTDPAAPATAPATQASASLTIANKYCAVMSDHEIDPKVTVANAGKTIGFCCKDCIPTFEKEPAKYLAALK
jgi:hypothetical protein